MNIKNLLSFLILFGFLSGLAQEKGHVKVDDEGVMRWSHNNAEVQGFGVNYSTPFAHAFRSAEKMGVNLREEIDRDVCQMARLGFDLYRIHVWDTEISDAEGNLLENEHLELFDYLLKQLKERHINFVITPIAYWGNGWPEPDEDTPGFSNKFGKAGNLTHPDALKAQQNYLKQFLEHINPHTGMAYKDEPNIIAFEISNEPHHKGAAQEVTNFVSSLKEAIQSTGTKKPVFYNVSHSIHLAEAYFDAGIDGGTFQWYPTGLGFQKELEGNLLPNVDRYEIPFNEVIKEHKAAKIVYEFDAADSYRSYMYPAMARSFRQAGIQIATQFAYEPGFLAAVNTDYNTHYMNLGYTPHKALGLMIAGEVFHRIPLNSDFGSYPKNLEFGDFSLNYESDLALLNAEDKFLYSNSTEALPKSEENLKQIAGYGSSKLVKYEGKGAYFLDKLDKGLWRLEVYPDAVLVNNSFGRNSLQRELTVIKYNSWPMQIELEDLGSEFKVEAINNGNSHTGSSVDGKFEIKPGTYLLSKAGLEFDKNKLKLSSIELDEFGGPASDIKRTYVIHEAVKEISENSELEILAEIVSDQNIEKAEAWLQNGNTYESLELKRDKAYTYKGIVPKDILKNGFLKYHIIVETSEDSRSFPGNIAGKPGDWDYHNPEIYQVAIVPTDKPLNLFNAAEDEEYVVGQWMKSLNLVPTTTPGEAEYQVNVAELFTPDEENPEAEPVYDYSFKYNFSRKIAGRKETLKNSKKLILKARALNSKNTKLQVALLMKNGAAFGKIVDLIPETKEIEIALDELEPVATVNLPRPYPGFQPYFFEHENPSEFKIEEVEAVQFSIGPGLNEEQVKQPQGVGIIRLELD